MLVKGLPEMLMRQFEYEDPIVRGGKHLLHSAFFKELVALACDLVCLWIGKSMHVIFTEFLGLGYHVKVLFILMGIIRQVSPLCKDWIWIGFNSCYLSSNLYSLLSRKYFSSTSAFSAWGIIASMHLLLVFPGV